MITAATWDGSHWVQLAEPIEITEFRCRVEQARAMAVPWDAASRILEVLARLDGGGLDQVGVLVDELTRLAERRLL